MVSERARRVRPSGIRKVFERAALLKNPIDFSIGQPHFDVPDLIQQAAIEAIRAGKNRYTVTQGIPELNAKVAARLGARLGRPIEHTMITAGVSGGLTLAYLTLLDPGDEILLPEPHFVLYRVLAEILGVEPRYYNLYPDFKLTRAALEAACSERTKVLLLNSPSNPTGAVHSFEELQIAADFARERGLALISDEIYDSFVYDEPYRSVAELVPDTLVLGGFSKTFGMPGWRMGYAAGPQDVIDAMAKMQQFTFVCAPTPAQHAGVVALDLDLAEYVAAYRRKRDRICEALADHYDLVRPGGSFYLFPPLPHGQTSESFTDRALEQELLIVPGRAFSQQDSHFRISFAVEDAVLDQGIEVLLRLAERSRQAPTS